MNNFRSKIRRAYLTVKLHYTLRQQLKWYETCTDPLKKSMLASFIAIGWAIYSRMPMPWYVRCWLFTKVDVPTELKSEDAIVPPSASMLKDISIAADKERNQSMNA